MATDNPGAAIRRARLRRGLTLKEVGHACGLSESMLSQVERGLKRPGFESMFRLADAVGLRASRLIAGYREAG
jgi:transcriptional regulator with XRE-family HTH domain